MFHELKILPEHFEPVMAGIKLAELPGYVLLSMEG
nr:MAG TPA: protein of unknown function DUF3850 [Caudoviricetes sp.]